MADRRYTRIHLYEPGSIREIKNEVESHKARQMEAFHHMFRDHRHLQMINQSDDTRRPVLVAYFNGFDADSCKNFAFPTNHRPIGGAANYILLQADCSTKRQHKRA